MKTIILKISKETHKDLKVYAVQTSRTLQDVIEDALKQYVNNNSQKDRGLRWQN